jgi:hypothetical protein
MLPLLKAAGDGQEHRTSDVADRLTGKRSSICQYGELRISLSELLCECDKRSRRVSARSRDVRSNYEKLGGEVAGSQATLGNFLSPFPQGSSPTEKAGWEPELLAKRITQLGDAAFMTPWDPNLRSIWSEEYERCARDYPDDPCLAYDITAAILSQQSFARLVGPDDDRLSQIATDLPKIYPAFAMRDARARLKVGDAQVELVAAFQSVRQARRITGAGGDLPMVSPCPPPDEGLLLRLELAVPEGVDETAFHRALDLIRDENFRAARRRLWSWEKHISTATLDQESAQLVVDGLIRDYNAPVERHSKKTRLQFVFQLVPLVLDAGIHVASSGFPGASALCSKGVHFAADRVKAKFPILTETGAPVSHHPGSAVSGALSVLAHD